MNNIFKETQKRERVNYDVAALVARDVQKTKLRENCEGIASINKKRKVTEKSRMQCNSCENTFARKENLKKHIQRFHT